jgi:hypothetical protein
MSFTINEAKEIVVNFSAERVRLEHTILDLELTIQEINFIDHWTDKDRKEYALCQSNCTKSIQEYRRKFAADPICQHIKCDLFGARAFRDYLATLG